MKGYIEREALIKEGWLLQRTVYGNGSATIESKQLKAIPAADVVEVRHGRWIGTEFDGYADGNPVYDVFECSVCGCEYDTDDGEMHHNYCPNCGAKMDGGGDDAAD